MMTQMIMVEEMISTEPANTFLNTFREQTANGQTFANSTLFLGMGLMVGIPRNRFRVNDRVERITSKPYVCHLPELAYA
jgi:hypothetical protein